MIIAWGDNMATPYRLAMIEAVRALGIKKAIGEMMWAAGLLKDNEQIAGSVIVHHNCGGITKIIETKEIK